MSYIKQVLHQIKNYGVQTYVGSTDIWWERKMSNK